MATSNSDLYEYERLQLKDAAGTIDALIAENDRLTACLEKANISTEHFEREWYLRGDELDTLRAQLAEAQKDSDRLDWIEQNANMGVAINRLKHITDLSRLVYEVAVDDVYATEDTLRAAIDAAKGKTP